MSDVAGDGTLSKNSDLPSKPKSGKSGMSKQPAFPPKGMDLVPDPVSMLKNPTPELVAELNEFGQELRKDDESFRERLAKINPAKVGNCLLKIVSDQGNGISPRERPVERRTSRSKAFRGSANNGIIEHHAN